MEKAAAPGMVMIQALTISLAFAQRTAFGRSVVVMLAIFWRLRELTLAILLPVGIFFVFIALAALAVFWLGERVNQVLPTWLLRLPVVGTALKECQETTPAGLWNPRLVTQTTLLAFVIFLFDAATLSVLLFAMGADCHPLIVFASFVAASVVAMIGLVPGGLGTFEGTCVAMLHVHGVSLEAALTCTLLLRGVTFWLPMLPGLWLARRELT
jgi:uncharacterized protein (TIRG00374 family)